MMLMMMMMIKGKVWVGNNSGIKKKKKLSRKINYIKGEKSIVKPFHCFKRIE